MAILRAKAQSMGVAVDDEAVDQLARPVVTNVRELEGTLNRAVALASLYHTTITSAIVARAIQSGPRPTATLPQVSQDQLISAVAKYYGIIQQDLTGPRRNKKLVAARQLAMHMMSAKLQMGVTEIGRAIGRDHSTVTHSLKKVNQLLPSDLGLQADINAISELLL